MSDECRRPWSYGMSRRQALWLFGAGSVGAGLSLGADELDGASAQIAAPRNLRIVGIPAADSPVARGLHPRSFLTPGAVDGLRSRLASDAAFRTRWQQAVTAFESAGGYWATNSTNPITISFAAFLACVRRPGNDVGLSWGSSWQTYRDRIVAATKTWIHTGESGSHALAHAMVYDLLYADLTAAERSELHGWIIGLLDNRSKLKWQSQGGHWDDQTSDEHLARVVLSVAADDAPGRVGQALQESLDYADAHEQMQYGEGIGYAWKAVSAANLSPVISLWVLRNAMGLSERDTTDYCLVSLRDSWQHVRQFVIPHPGYPSVSHWKQARVNFQAPLVPHYHRGANVGSFMLWALALLPGRVQLADDGMLSDRRALAASEDALFGYLQHILDDPTPRQPAERLMSNVITNYKWVASGGDANERGNLSTFLAFAPWLIMNVQPRPRKDPETAGIPRVRRWWPGTLNWVTIIGGQWESGADQSLISYSHRRWYSNNYTAGVMQNGMWQVHRGGPLLIKRGSTSHGPVGKLTWGGNGTVGFYDVNRPEFVGDVGGDAGEIRTGKSHERYQDIVTDPACDFGQVTSWFADAQVVAITSDLTRSYNSTVVNSNGEAARISAFTREFVCVQRGADGTDHERIFTYDRMAVLGNGRFQPRYNLCPATEPDIDGVETPYTPWHPGPTGTSLADPRQAYRTTGPVRWDYSGASRLVYDSSRQAVPANATGPGNGKVVVTWLEPSRGNALVRKRGGTAMVWEPSNSRIDRSPAFGPYGELYGKDGAWDDVNDPTRWMYAGLFTVQVMHSRFDPDTRFLMACDVMSSHQTPDPAAALPCDGGSAAARCGASAVVFSRDPAGHSSGFVTIPAGVTLVVLANLPPGAPRTLSPNGGLTIVSPGRTASAGNNAPMTPNRHGRLVISVGGAGTLTFS